MFYHDIGIKNILSALLFPHTGYFLFTFSPGSIFLKLFSYKYIQNNNLKGEYFKHIMYFFLHLIYWIFFLFSMFDHFHLSHNLSGLPFLLYPPRFVTMFLGISSPISIAYIFLCGPLLEYIQISKGYNLKEN